MRNEKEEEAAEQPLYPDWFYVATPDWSYTVSRVMARHIEHELARPLTRWITFVDIAGSRVRLRTGMILALEQSSPETREAWKKFRAERSRDEESPGWNR